MPKVKIEEPEDSSGSEKFPRRIVEGDKKVKLGFVVERSLGYLTKALSKLSIAYAVTGRTVGFEAGMNPPFSKITIALLDTDPLISPQAVEDRIANLRYDGKELFTINRPNPLCFKDPRLTFTTNTCDIVFFRVDSITLAAQAPYSNLVKSKHGWSMTSPFFSLLDYLMEVTRKIHKSILFGATTVLKTGPGPKGLKLHHSGTVGRMMSVLTMKIQKQAPGNPSDHQFLEKEHVEAIQYLAKLFPDSDLSSFLPFQSLFPPTNPVVVKKESSPKSNAKRVRRPRSPSVSSSSDEDSE